jgi:uncharacterized membrane protein
MDQDAQRRRLVRSGVLLGVGLGGFFDGIVLHQILQWHHMVSHTRNYPVATVKGLEANTFADGLFHAFAYIVTIVGLFLLLTSLGRANEEWSTRAFVGLLAAGWGLFNVVEGIVDHHILRIHNVRDDVAEPLPWNLGFLGVSVALLAFGWWLYRTSVNDTAQSTLSP